MGCCLPTVLCDVRYMCCTSWNIAPPLHTLLNFPSPCPGVTVWLQTRSCRRWAATKQSVLPGWMMPDLLDRSNPTPAHREWGGNFPSVSIPQHYRNLKIQNIKLSFLSRSVLVFKGSALVLRPIVLSRFVGTLSQYYTPAPAATAWSNSLVDAEAMFLFKQPPPHTHFNTRSHPLNITPCVCLSLYSCLPSPRTEHGASCVKSSFSTNRSGSEGLCSSSSSHVVWHSAVLSPHDSLIDGTCSAD